MSQRRERVYGPFKHRNKWRIVGVRVDGTRVCQSFETHEQAQEAKDQALVALGAKTVSSLVTDYLGHLSAQGRRESTVETARHRLVGFFGLSKPGSDMILADLTPKRAESVYKARTAKVKPDTHQGELSLVKAMFAWAVKRRIVTGNPFEGVETVGAKSLGRDKSQLRLDEARDFLAACLADGSPEGLACAIALLTGARASEVVDRVCRDVDDSGGLLWVSRAKTGNGNRPLVIPHPEVKARLYALAKSRGPGEPLWGPDKDRHWLFYHVKRLCMVAGVPEVTPHGLRRSHATIARVSGVAAETVARELGQGSPAVTQRSYFAPGADSARSAQDVGTVLGGASPGGERAPVSPFPVPRD